MYFDWYMEEALRLHPPSFEQTRIALQDIVIDNNYILPKNTELHLFHFYSQRNPEIWGKNANEFIPERHKERAKNQKMFPFSYGPTSCVGRQFTMFFVKTFVMTLITNYTWESSHACKRLKGPVALKLVPDAEIILRQREKITHLK